jgi:hypothetical protein
LKRQDLRGTTTIAERLIDVEQTIAFSHSATSPRRVFLSKRERAGYGTADLVLIVPDIVPVGDATGCGGWAWSHLLAAPPKVAVLP